MAQITVCFEACNDGCGLCGGGQRAVLDKTLGQRQLRQVCRAKPGFGFYCIEIGLKGTCLWGLRLGRKKHADKISAQVIKAGVSQRRVIMSLG